MTTLANLNLAALLNLHNGAIVEFGAPEGFGEVAKFKSKAAGVTAIEALCAAGNLAVAFDGDNAVIVDATPSGDNYGPNDGDADDVDEAVEVTALGDGKGKVRAWGVALGSAEWLAANPRGSEAREAYRTERRKAARMHRKAERKAKADAQAVATE